MIRLVGAVLQEVDGEWRTGKRYFSLESMRKHYEDHPSTSPTAPALRGAPVLAPVH